MKNTYELAANYDARKSFYGKARVIVYGGCKKLLSYDTIVAEIKNGKLKLNGYYSNTTARHIREFAGQEGFGAITKKQMDNEETITL